MNKVTIVLALVVVALLAFLVMTWSKPASTVPTSGTTSSQSTMSYAPVPESAKGPVIPQDKGYLVKEIKDGVYYVDDGSYQAMFVVSNQGVIVVNAPASLGKKLLPAIKDVTDKPVTHVVYSVSKADFISGAGNLPKTATYIAQNEAAAYLKERKADDAKSMFGVFNGGGAIPLPTVTFDDTYTVTSGNQTLELSYKGPSVASGNSMVYAPKQKVLYMADVVFPGWVPYRNLVYSHHPADLMRAHDDILTYDFETYLGGHFRPGTKQDVTTQKEYLTDVQNNAMGALQKVDFMGVAKKTGFENTWLLIGTYLTDVAQNCTDATVSKWKDKLGGADIFTFGHCDAMVQSLRTD